MGKKDNGTVWSEIVRKLTSRKFWLAVTGFVTGVLVLCGTSSEQADKIGGSIMAGASVLAYAIGEGLVDRKDKK